MKSQWERTGCQKQLQDWQGMLIVSLQNWKYQRGRKMGTAPRIRREMKKWNEISHSVSAYKLLCNPCQQAAAVLIASEWRYLHVYPVLLLTSLYLKILSIVQAYIQLQLSWPCPSYILFSLRSLTFLLTKLPCLLNCQFCESSGSKECSCLLVAIAFITTRSY